MNYYLKKHKLIAWVILLTFVFTSIMPTNLIGFNSVASAADPVRMTGAQLKEAIKAANGNYTLLSDVYVNVDSQSVNVNSEDEFTIHLNGHNIYVEEGQNDWSLFYVNGGKLTINGASFDATAGTVAQMEHNYGNLATYDSQRGLTYYVTIPEKDRSAKGQTTETVKQYTMTNNLIVGAGKHLAVQILNGGTVTMNGGAITNFNRDENGGAVTIGESCSFTLDGGVIAANTSKNEGGAIDANGKATLTLTSGVIAGNKSNTSGGGGVMVRNGAVMNINGGYITNNVAGNNGDGSNGGVGGGAIRNYNATITMTDGAITGNYAGNAGGGVQLAYTGDSSAMIMEGGFVSSNVANKAEGGGISLGAGYLEITGGYITNNRTNTPEHWGGGGIFCSDQGTVIKIVNSLITKNTADGYGGGVAGCSTGRINIVFTDNGGTAIFGNDASGTKTSGSKSSKNEDRRYAAQSKVFTEGGYEDYFCALSSEVAGKMLGGGYANWTGSADNIPVDQNGGTDAPVIASYIMGLTARPAGTDSAAAVNAAEVFITGNHSSVHGGGILANGYLILGNGNSITTYPSLELIPTKKLKVNGAEKTKTITRNGGLWNGWGGSKTVTVADLGENVFEFQIATDEDFSNIIYTGKNDSNGDVTFNGKLGFADASEGNQYTYYLREKPTTGLSAVEQSGEVYKIDVTIGEKSNEEGPDGHKITRIKYYISHITIMDITTERKVYDKDLDKGDSHSVTICGDNYNSTDSNWADAGLNFTNTMLETTDVTVSKLWSDNRSTTRPEKVYVVLQNTASPVGEDSVWENATEVFELTAGNQWTKTIKGLPKQGKAADGTTIDVAYRIVEMVEAENESYVEGTPEGYVASYAKDADGTDYLTIVNTAVTEVTGTKTWIDPEGTEHNNATEVELTLTRTSETVAEPEKVDATPEWNDATYTFRGLAKYDAAGAEYSYAVTEKQVDGYDVPDYGTNADGSAKTAAENGGTIINHIAQEKIRVEGTKHWSNKEDGQGGEVTIILTRDDGEKYTTTTALHYVFEDLDKYNVETGHKYSYKLKEQKVDGYIASYTQTINGDTTIIDILNTSKEDEFTGVTVSKVWEIPEKAKYADGTDVKPVPVTVALFANGVAVNDEEGNPLTVKLSADNKPAAWTATFENLPKYKEGKLISYTVAETDAPAGFVGVAAPVEDGYVITNTWYAGEIGTFEVKKSVEGTGTKETGFEFMVEIKAELPDWGDRTAAKLQELKDALAKAKEAVARARWALNETNTTGSAYAFKQNAHFTTASSYQYILTDDEGNAIYGVTGTSPSGLIWKVDGNYSEATQGEGSIITAVMNAIKGLANRYSSIHDKTVTVFLEDLVDEYATSPSSVGFSFNAANNLLEDQAALNEAQDWEKRAQADVDAYMPATTPSAITLIGVSTKGQRVEKTFTPKDLQEGRYVLPTFTLDAEETMTFTVIATTGSQITYQVSEVGGWNNDNYKRTDVQVTGLERLQSYSTAIYKRWMELGKDLAVNFFNVYEKKDDPYYPPYDPEDPEKPTDPENPVTPEEPIDDPNVPTGAPGEPDVEFDIDDPEIPLGAPQTGDAANAAGMMALLVLAAAGLATTRRKFN